MPYELEELRRLPVGEKLRIVEPLWDDVAASKEPFPFPEWLLGEARRRAAETDADESSLLTSDEFQRQVP